MRILAAVAAAGLWLLLPITPLWAQQEHCQTVCSNFSEGVCHLYTHACLPDVPSPSAYGAIAYSRKTGASGYAYGWDSQAKAESVALENCKKEADDCESTVWYEGECGAVAANGGNPYWGLGNDASAAGASAMDQCQKAGNQNCKIVVARCSAE